MKIACSLPDVSESLMQDPENQDQDQHKDQGQDLHKVLIKALDQDRDQDRVFRPGTEQTP